MCALMMSMGAMVFGYNYQKTYFKGSSVWEDRKLTSASFKVSKKDDYPSYLQWNSNKTTGYYYIGYMQKLADGTYGGASSERAKMLSSATTGGKAFWHYMYANYQKAFITGGDNANFKVTQLLVQYN